MAQAETQRKTTPAGAVAERIICDLEAEFPKAVFLINNEVYGDEELDIDIFVPEGDLLKVKRRAIEVTMKLEDETDHFIALTVVPLECCPIRV